MSVQGEASRTLPIAQAPGPELEYHAPPHSPILRAWATLRGAMHVLGPPNDAHEYAGCRLFTSATGLTGFALGAEGEMEGWLYDFFASPHESEKTVQAMVALAIEQGANKLVTYEHPLLAEYFIRFCFQPTNLVRLSNLDEAPPGWVPEMCRAGVDGIRCPDFLNMILVKPKHALPSGAYEEIKGASAFRQLLESVRRASTPEAAIAPHAPCGHCGRAVASRTRSFGVVGGYTCEHCGFVHVYGTLTLRYRLSAPRPRRSEACPCGSGKAFAACHGAG